MCVYLQWVHTSLDKVKPLRNYLYTVNAGNMKVWQWTDILPVNTVRVLLSVIYQNIYGEERPVNIWISLWEHKSTIRRKLILKQRKKLDSKTLQNYLA